MKYIDVRKERVPALGFGTWQLENEDCEQAVRHALELGYRHIDTAQMYGNEAAVGRGIESSGIPRDEIFLASKVWIDNLRPEDVVSSTDESLNKLRTDYIDLLLIHWPSQTVPLSETLSAMLDVQEAGKTRHIGVSNFPPAHLNEALELAPVFCDQVEYHPFLSQDALLEEVREHGIMLTAYCPLARGGVAHEPTLKEIGERHGKSAAQVALRWLMDQENVAAIPKAASASHRKENIDIFGFELTDDDMKAISLLVRGERLIDPPFAPEWEAAAGRAV